MFLRRDNASPTSKKRPRVLTPCVHRSIAFIQASLTGVNILNVVSIDCGMALPLQPGLTPPEIAFLCEMEIVTVIPRQRLERLELLGVSGHL